jgi:3,4-dihydroxy 2-butanone 4-phosphate synthase/GTP cyclohydrolase II
VLVRAGHSEASVDLANLAGLKPAAVICEIMKSDGTMARLPDLLEFAKLHGLLLSSIAELISYREARESLVQLVAETKLVHQGVPMRAYAYRSTIAGDHHLALVSGTRLGPGCEVQEPVLVRVQKEAVLSDVFALPGTAPAHCCMKQILEAENGCLLYMRDTLGRGLPASLVRMGGFDHRQAPDPELTMDPREYGIGAQILHHLGVRRMRLITSADRHITALSGHGLELIERVRPLG